MTWCLRPKRLPKTRLASGGRPTTAIYMRQEIYRDPIQKKARMIEVCRALCGPEDDMIALDADAMIHDLTNKDVWNTLFTYDPRLEKVQETSQYLRI